MKDFYKEIQERMKVLEAEKSTPEIEGRKAEMQLVIIRVQQILLKDVGKKKREIQEYCRCQVRSRTYSKDGSRFCGSCDKEI